MNGPRVRTLVLLLSVAGSVSLTGQTPAGRVRVIPYGPNLPIVERLLPDDEIVRLDRPREPEAARQLTAQEFLTALLDASQIVAVVRADEVKGILVDNGTWVNTLVAVRVQRALLDADRSIPFGGPMNLQWSGGDLPIGNTLVRAWEPPRLQPDKQYLVFHTGGGVMGTLAAYLIEDLKLVSTWPVERTRIKDPLDGAAFNDVTAALRLRTQ